jgi:hypothetical protein
MRKLIALFCILALAIASTAIATETRVLTLGEVDDIIRDDANVQMYPQTIRMYPNFGVAEIMGANFHTSGWHMTHGDFTMGSYWTTEEWADGYQPFDFDGDGTMGLDQKFSLIYGRDLAGMPFGFSFELFANKDENKGASQALNSGLGMKIGAGVTLMEALETSIGFGMYSWESKDAAGATGPESEGGTIIEINARYWMPETEWGVMVPHFSFGMMSSGVKPPTGSSTKDDMTMIVLGIGGTMPAAEGIIVVHDMGVQFGSQTVDPAPGGGKDEFGMNLLPYFKGGMEAPLSEHFTFRCGGVKEWYLNSMKNGSDEHNTSGANTRLYIGAGYNRGHFNLDANVDPGFFTRGPYFITGAAGALATQVSLTYMW